MLGLRPRLRARHSLFDLIAQNHPSPRRSETGRSSRTQQLFDEDIDDLPPLPTSPAPSPSLRGEFVIRVQSPLGSPASEASESLPEKPVLIKMAPVSSHGFIEIDSTLTALPIHSPKRSRSGTREMSNTVGGKLQWLLKLANTWE